MRIISDFSKTFTFADMPSTWSVFAKSGLLGEDYIRERDRLYEENIAYEKAGDIKKTNAWFRAHAELFVRYGLTRDLIREVVADDLYFASREGVKEFLDQKNNITIISSGITACIEEWFYVRGYDMSHINIIANDLEFDDRGRATGVKGVTRTPLDKFFGLDEIVSAADIVLGDSREDIPYVFSGKSYGFTDEDGIFDVKLGKEGSMEEVGKDV